MASNKNKTLYICYFGLREPLVQTQVVQYLREIAKLADLDVSLVTFEPGLKKNWTPEQVAEEKEKLAADGIDWHALPYHKWPSLPATLYDVLRGMLFARKSIRRNGVTILHARSHVPMLMAVLARKAAGKNVKLLFDIRGFFPEEYTEGGRWKKDGLLFKAVKRVERWLLREADGFVVLTEKARDILFPGSRETGLDTHGRPVEVIPCCVDLTRFVAANGANDVSRNEIREKYGLGKRKVMVYIGALGTWYLLDEMADLFQTARERDDSTFAMILTQSSPEIMSERLKARGFSDGDMLIKKVPPGEIPAYLSAADTAVSFIKPCYSKLSSSPTKNAEYLASGVPLIGNEGVGDVDELINEDKIGVLVDEFSGEGYVRALDKLEQLRQEENFADRCRESAENRFDLKAVGGVRYRRLYEKLIDG